MESSLRGRNEDFEKESVKRSLDVLQKTFNI